MSGLGAFVVGAAVGAAVVSHHKDKQRQKNSTVVVHSQQSYPVPNQHPVVFVNNHPPAKHSRPKEQHYGPHYGPPHGPPHGVQYGPPHGTPGYGPPHGASYGPPHGAPYGPPHGAPYGPPHGAPHGPPHGASQGYPSPQYSQTTIYQSAPMSPGHSRPIGFICTQTTSTVAPPSSFPPAQPPPYSPYPPPVQPLPHSSPPAPTSPGYLPPGYPQAQPFQSPGCLLIPPSPSTGYPSNRPPESTGYPPPLPSPSSGSFQPGGYPPALPPSGFQPSSTYPQPPGMSFPSPSSASSTSSQHLQTQVNVQLSAAAAPAHLTSEVNNTTTSNYRRCFLLVNADTGSLLLANAASGWKLIVQPQHGTSQQLTAEGGGGGDRQGISARWYFDSDGVIRNHSNDYVIEPKDGGAWLCLAPRSGDLRQQWVLKEGKILASGANPSDCICLEDGLMETAVNADVIVARYQGKPHHHWKIVYL